jgi:hypothetical protein
LRANDSYTWRRDATANLELFAGKATRALHTSAQSSAFFVYRYQGKNRKFTKTKFDQSFGARMPI